VTKLRVLDLFSGIGGFSLGLKRAKNDGQYTGFETVAFCEIEAFPRKVLAKHWPNVPCYDDVRTLTAEQLASDGIAVDVICGGFPCQDLSSAGYQAGIGQETRSGLFRQMLRIAVAVRPCFIIFENVSRLLSGPKEEAGQWFWEFLWALAEGGYDAEWHCITAASIGAPHERDRIWIIAYPNQAQFERGCISRRIYQEHTDFSDACWGQDKPGMERASNGLPHQMDRVGACGNAVVPQIPELIGNAILEAINT